MNEEKSVFVYYSFYENMESCKWKYGKFPDGWYYCGGGIRISINKKTWHEYDEQFNGPKMSRNAMRYMLDKTFTELHQRSIIKRYIICNAIV